MKTMRTFLELLPYKALDKTGWLADCPACGSVQQLVVDPHARTITCQKMCDPDGVLAIVGCTREDFENAEIDIPEFVADESPASPVAHSDDYLPGSMLDAHLGARVAAEHLRGDFVSWGRSAWSRWDGKRWQRCTETAVFEAVRRAVLDIHRSEMKVAERRKGAADEDARGLTEEKDRTNALGKALTEYTKRSKELNGMFIAGKMASVLRVARGLIEVRQEDFDNHPDLLNVANGVVDLRTGELKPHDPTLMFTKVAPTSYRPDASHPDWDTALTALPVAVADWMQIRFGQAVTGHATQDDVVPFLKGGGANGKSTVLTGIQKALGDFATVVPDKVLLASPSDHPTELMTLKGARLAFIEELPEGDYLNAQRLKKAAGTDAMTARHIGQDNVTWAASHSLFVTTNYDVQVDAVDWGTWRRLALVNFPYTFDGSDPDHQPDATLRLRMLRPGERHEAALSWLVDGARLWYNNGSVIPAMPSTVKADTAAWRNHANQAARFLDELYEPAPESAVLASEVYADFAEWIQMHGGRRWSDRVFWQRARQHDWFRTDVVDKAEGSVRTAGWIIEQTSGRPLKAQERLVTGIRRVT